eukprot:887023_1
MGVTAILSFSLVLLIEKIRTSPRILSMVTECCSRRRVSDEDDDEELDEDVQMEISRILDTPGGEACNDIIQFKNLRKTYGNRTVVRDLTYGVPDGEIFGFLGVNGAGKTTSMKML